MHKYCMFIYRITNTANGKVYIGQTKGSPERRFKNHLDDAKRGVGSPLCRAIRKYGEDKFLLEVLRTGLTADTIDRAEIDLIAEHRSYARDANSNGYNQTRGGKGWTSDVCVSMFASRRYDNYSDAAKKRARALIVSGKHNFLGAAGSENARRLNAKLVAEGNHPSSKVRTCDKCGHQGRGPNMFRYHFGNCSVMKEF